MRVAGIVKRMQREIWDDSFDLVYSEVGYIFLVQKVLVGIFLRRLKKRIVDLFEGFQGMVYIFVFFLCY